mmetsp:Transcript_60278/g.111796  ORF Transcript_60278/g.111796 Transcript_60278/m.111796 type:complete len:124 (-) Transcript_60278:191-562(-)
MDTITFLITLAVKPDADDKQVRETMALLAKSVSEKPGALFYQSYQKTEGKLEFIETFKDSDAALYHLRNQPAELAATWFSMIELETISVIGPASDELKKELGGYPLANKPVYHETISGFPPSS